MSISNPSNERNLPPDLSTIRNATAGLSLSETVDAILADQRTRHDAGQLVKVEHYLDQFPGLDKSESVVIDLIYNEFLLRNENDQPPKQEFLQRFPRWSDSLEKQFQVFEAIENSEGFENSLHQEVIATRTDLNTPSLTLGRSELQAYLDERFRLETVLGQGTFAIVYRAYDKTLKRHVAIKFAKTIFDGRSIEQERFFREAKLAAGLAHPGVIRVYELGNQETSPYIVQEFVSGGTLKQQIFRQDYSLNQAAIWVSKIGDAIEYAHQFGIVHRDLKPANILFDDRGEPKVADFGLASLAEQESNLTKQGDLLGTPAYMSPEQACGETVGPLSDVYSLGVVLFELIYGRPPFVGNVTSVIEQVTSRSPQRPKDSNRVVPRDLQVICFKAMAKSPADRYRSAQELAQDLRRFTDGLPILSKPSGILEKACRWCVRQPAFALTILAAMIAIMVVATVSFVQINFERNRFRQQRDIANASLFDSLVNSAEIQINSKPPGWYDKAIGDIQKAADLDVAKANRKPLQQLLLEALSDTALRIETVASWQGRDAPITALATSGSLVGIGYDDGVISVIEEDFIHQVAELRGPSQSVRQLSFADQGRELIGLSGSELWNWKTDNSAETVGKIVGHDIQTFAIVDDNESQLVTIDLDGMVSLIDLPTRKPITQWSCGGSKVTSLSISDTGSLIAIGQKNRSLKIWNMVKGTQVVATTTDDPALTCSILDDDLNDPLVLWSTRVSYSTESLLRGEHRKSEILPAAIRQIQSLRRTGFPYSLAVVGMDDGSVRVSDVNHSVLAETKLMTGLSCVAVNQDSKTIFVGNDNGNISKMTLAGANIANRFRSVHGCAFTPDSKLVFDSTRISLPEMSYEPLENVNVTAIRTGKRFDVIAGTRSGHLFVKKRDAKLQPDYLAHDRPIVSITTGKSEQWFASADELGNVNFWDSENLACLAKQHFDVGELSQIASHPDHEFLFATGSAGVSWTKVAKVGDSLQLREPEQLSRPFASAQKAFVDCSSTHVCVANGPQVSVYELSNLEIPKYTTTQSSNVLQIQFSHDGESLFCLTAEDLSKWNLSDWTPGFREPLEIQCHQFALDPANRFVLLANRQSGTVPVLDFDNGNVVASIFVLRSPERLSVSHDANSVLLGSCGVRHQSLNEVENTINNHPETTPEITGTYDYLVPGGAWTANWSTAVSPNNRWIASTRHDRNVTIRDTVTLRIETLIGGFESEVWCSTFSKDSTLLAVGSEYDEGTGKVTIINTDDWSVTRAIPVSTRLVAGVSFHPFAPWLAVSSFDGSVYVINYRTGKTLQQLLPCSPKTRQLSNATMDIEFSDDGQWLAAARMTKGVVIWQLKQENDQWDQEFAILPRPKTITLPKQRIWAVAFDAKTKRIASASESGQVDFFSLDSFDHIVSFRSGTTRIRTIGFAPNDKFLAVSAWAASGVVWNLELLEQKLDNMGLGIDDSNSMTDH